MNSPEPLASRDASPFVGAVVSALPTTLFAISQRDVLVNAAITQAFATALTLDVQATALRTDAERLSTDALCPLPAPSTQDAQQAPSPAATASLAIHSPEDLRAWAAATADALQALYAVRQAMDEHTLGLMRAILGELIGHRPAQNGSTPTPNSDRRD